METKERDEGISRIPLLANGILFTFTLIILQNLLGSNLLSSTQQIALILFTVALPCLAGYAFLIYSIQINKVDPQKRTRLFICLQWIGGFADIVGITLIIFNSSQIAGLCFVFASIMTLIIAARTNKHIIELHSKIYAPQKGQTCKQKTA